MVKKQLNIGIVILISVIVVTVVSFISMFWAINDHTAVNTLITSGDVVDFSEGWKNENGVQTRINEFSVTDALLSVERPIVFRKTIDAETAGSVVFMHTRNLAVNIYVADEPVHITSRTGSISKMSGFDNFIIARLPPLSAGKELRFEIFKTEYSAGHSIDNIKAGSGAVILKTVFSASIIPIVLGSLGAVMGIGFVIIGIFTRKKLEIYLVSVYFGLYLFFISSCMVFDTAWMHISVNNIVFVEKGVRIFLVASVPAFIAFVDNFCEMEHYYVSKVLVFASAAFVPITFILDVTGVLYYVSSTIFIHLLVVIFSVVIIIELIIYMTRAHKLLNRKKRLGYISVIILLVCNVCDVLIYYGWSGIFDNFNFTRWGVLVTTAAVVTACFGEIFEMIKLGVQAGRIGKIAFTDANTGIGNVAAFKAKFDDLEAKLSKYKYIGIIQFDVNNLKIINDSKGHEAGDLLIKTAAGIIERSFRNVGSCYRTGGDEFVAIIEGDHAPISCEEAIYRFNKEIDKFNDDPDKPFELRIAHGVAYYQSDVTIGQSLKEIHKLADERMYDNKKMLKARYAHSPEEAEVR